MEIITIDQKEDLSQLAEWLSTKEPEASLVSEFENP